MAAIVGGARLEERLAQPRQIVFADADAGILDRNRKLAARRARALTVTLPPRGGELDGVGDEIDQDLVERAAVGDDLGQIRGASAS